LQKSPIKESIPCNCQDIVKSLSSREVGGWGRDPRTVLPVLPHCNTLCHTLQHDATHCNTLCNTEQRTATHSATLCNTLKHTLQHTLQHTATHSATHSTTHCNTLCNTLCNKLCNTQCYQDTAESLLVHTYSVTSALVTLRGGGLGSSTIFKKFNETYAPS